ncbi:hypothetical protein EW146_g423 [Bondarzewia mesenterica]|uniref:Uncharacterized protein n=1 Tax=Bondarzewia mesenterica TaxID=1095465 RepID=A0A4S4MDC6_9AGAM|nr:hypothetical protein EW146_g423 [Bondarzewia mesenterica]
MFGPKDPAKKAEKALAKEAKSDAKALDRAANALHSTEKAQIKAQKAAEKAADAEEEAVKTEHKAAIALDDATHKHDVAVTQQRQRHEEVQLKQDHNQKLKHDVADKKAELASITRRKEAADKERDDKLAHLRITADPNAAADRIEQSATAAVAGGDPNQPGAFVHTN